MVEFTRFKDIFENERITVNQIYDLTDAEFDQLGVNKIGWRKAFRAAAQHYKIIFLITIVNNNIIY